MEVWMCGAASRCDWTYFVWRCYRWHWRCLLKCYRSHRWHMTHHPSPVTGTGESSQQRNAQTLMQTCTPCSLANNTQQLRFRLTAVMNKRSCCNFPLQQTLGIKSLALKEEHIVWLLFVYCSSLHYEQVCLIAWHRSEWACWQRTRLEADEFPVWIILHWLKHLPDDQQCKMALWRLFKLDIFDQWHNLREIEKKRYIMTF